MNSVVMNTQAADWPADLDASRDLNDQERQRFGFLAWWFESWRVRQRLELGRAAGGVRRMFFGELAARVEGGGFCLVLAIHWNCGRRHAVTACGRRRAATPRSHSAQPRRVDARHGCGGRDGRPVGSLAQLPCEDAGGEGGLQIHLEAQGGGFERVETQVVPAVARGA